MDANRKRILELINEANYNPLKIRDLSKKLSIKKSEYRKFKHLVQNMEQEGLLVRLRGGRYAPASFIEAEKGTFYARRSGRGIVIPEGGGTPLDSGAHLPFNILHGDIVLYRSASSIRGYKSAKITKILKRPGATLVGIYRASRRTAYFYPDDSRYPEMIPIDYSRSVTAVNGQKVVAQIDAFNSEITELECRITEVLGFPGDPHLDVESLIRSYNLPTSFPDEVEKQAEEISSRIHRGEINKREDFRNEITLTIDPESAKDFDDAVSIKKLPNKMYELGVHIADVSYFVSKSTYIDVEALERGTSAYLVDRVIPMLPEKLSNNLCSLRPNVDRLTLSCVMILNENGEVKSSRVVNSVIRSSARLSYLQVQKYFNNKKGFSRRPKIADALDLMLKVSKLLHERRSKRGSLDFDLPEPLITLDKEGFIKDISTYPRYDSHRLIEEFMLTANVEIAKYALSQALPILYRIHDKPDPAKIENFIENLKEYGFKFSFKGEITLKKLQRVVIAVEGKPEERMINELLLRSMQKALYQPRNIGHFALGFPVYTHFTSPIRRYPDLLVHRVVKKFIAGEFKKADFNEYKDILDKIGQNCSDREKNAERAERESIKVKTIQYISDRLGEIFGGVITGMIPSGFFVELENLFVDGLVRFEDLDDDYYAYDEPHYRAVGNRTGKVYKLGDKVRVIVNRVDSENKRIDLMIDSDRIRDRRYRKRKR
ncbi:MAG: ribonuclease R [candidate division Zixibacteria bacterium]|nr:ribonuclease R [candidate division Zixibacteria bacterium]